MSNSDRFSYNDGAICKVCKSLFLFRQSDQLIEGLKFPNGDFTIVRATCPHCFNQRTYTDEDIKRTHSNEDKDELIKELRNKISQLESDKNFLKKSLEEIFKEKIKDVAKTKNESQTQQQQTAKNEKFDHIA